MHVVFPPTAKQDRDEQARKNDASRKRPPDEQIEHDVVDSFQKLKDAVAKQNADLRAGADANPGCLPECGSDDFSKAYYIMEVAKPEDLPIGAWDTRVPGYRYWEPAALQMGDAPSVPSFCRISELVMSNVSTTGALGKSEYGSLEAPVPMGV